MSGYAEKTKVSVASSKAEIEATLNRFGIVDVVHGTVDGVASVMFKRAGRPYCIRVTLPDPNSREFRFTPGRGLERTPDQAYAAWEQACRVKWRELCLLIKAKLVAISNEAVNFEDEFLAYQMLPDRRTVGEWAETQLIKIESAGQMPALLPRAERTEI